MSRLTHTIPAAFAALLLTASAAAAQEAGTVKATHGAWQVRCADTQGQNVCIMSQVGKDTEGKDVIELQIRRLEGAKAQDGTAIPAAMQIVTPLGVALQAGVRLKVDAKKERGAPFETCAQGGCVVRQPVSTEFITELKGGSNAKLTVVAMPQKEIPVTLSLAGFTKAYDELK